MATAHGRFGQVLQPESCNAVNLLAALRDDFATSPCYPLSVGKTEEGWGRWTAGPPMSVDLLPALRPARVASNKGRIIGQKRPRHPRHVWSIRGRLEMADSARDLALFNMAVN